MHHFFNRMGDKLLICRSLWYTPGEDLTGCCGRSERAMAPADAFIGGRVYHHHTKLIMKDARTGGRFAPHQDRGYCKYRLHGVGGGNGVGSFLVSCLNQYMDSVARARQCARQCARLRARLRAFVASSCRHGIGAKSIASSSKDPLGCHVTFQK